ncbi:MULTISPECIES: hypothetical protein [Xanthomonas]|uniref:hypothetical protein n=1 Tax=Xanthomonas TaxID=338 RepID=UPI001115762F|nr:MULTISPECIES: hypothetical protein [Xanthomonas]MBL9195926.1 hypothetical protein [Xanthomonas fragariae]MBL9220564.1 hypothetical protein [Xanthomonas fragariae]MCC5094787.1 hypothetical protein [Xanthomonas campestris pv. incanae]MDM7571549.1 hypothetical protein [Xanthomonas fragariae]MDM7580848.1 hypothetical protein [Xanthomonas fragariae]
MKKISCGYVIDDDVAHSIWVAAYIAALKSKSIGNASALADDAVRVYFEKWRIDIPEGADPGAFLNSIQAAVEERYAKKISMQDLKT